MNSKWNGPEIKMNPWLYVLFVIICIAFAFVWSLIDNQK